MKGGLCILGVFALGLLAGYSEFFPADVSENALTIALCVMLFLAGMGMGFDVRNFCIMRTLALRLALLPLAIILGTAVGSVVAWGVLQAASQDLTLQQVLGVGAGFGYYSLSSLLITQMGDPALGSVALIANISRELMTLLCAPLLVRFLGELAPVATGGAASMDTCMPVIARYAGEHCAMMGVFSGIVLTLLVPVLVTGILSW